MKRFLTLGPTISFSHLVLSWIQSLEPQFYSQLAYRPHSEFFIMNFTFWIIWAARGVVEHFFNFLKVFSFWAIVKVSVCEFKRKSSSINQLQIKLGLHFLRRAIRQLGNIRWWPSIMWEFDSHRLTYRPVCQMCSGRFESNQFGFLAAIIMSKSPITWKSIWIYLKSQIKFWNLKV